MSDGMNTSESQVRTALLTFVAVHAIALCAFPLLPFIDLPNHLSEATIFQQYGAADNSLAEYYKPVPAYFPNTLHPVFCSMFSNIETGNKVFHVLCVVLLVLSVHLIIKKLNGNPWYGLLALLFTYNYNFTYGFVGFAMSIPMLFFLFYLILLDVERERVVIRIAIAVVLVLLFLSHAQNALLGLLLYGVVMLYTYWKTPGKLVARVLTVPLPLIVLIVSWWITRDKQNESSTLDYLFTYYTSSYFREFPMRFRIVVFDNFQLLDGVPGIIVAALFFLCVLIPVLWFKGWRNFSIIFKSRITIFAFVLLVVVSGCYMILPDKLPGQTPLFQRFTTIVILALIICFSVLLRNVTSNALKYFAGATVVVYSFFWIEYMYAFNKQNEGFNRSFFSEAPNQSRIAGLMYQSRFRGRNVYIHYPNYFVVWNKGIAASKIIDYRFGLVRRVADENTLPFYNELIGDGYKHIDTYDHLEYLLVHGQAPVQPDLNLEGFALTRQVGDWQLYRNARLTKQE